MDEKIALCDDCAIHHSQKRHHKLLSLQSCVNEARVVLSTVESQVKELIKDKESAVTRGRNVVKLIEAKRARYIEKQR